MHLLITPQQNCIPFDTTFLNDIYLYLFCRTMEDLLPLFIYVLCQAQIPYVYSEMSFMKEFIPGKLELVEIVIMITFQSIR